MNGFSGRGARLDGKRLLDIGAPGSTVYSTATKNTYAGYRAFGGTSSAGPHVAGAIALLLQGDSKMTSGEVRSFLHKSADQQYINGFLPNDEWGYGRLRIFDAFAQYLTAVRVEQLSAPNQYNLSAYPNPFNRNLFIRYFIEKEKNIKISIFNILGEEVIVLKQRFLQTGEYQTIWNGRDRYGNNAVSGIYFVKLYSSRSVLSHKILLLR